jgi:hypothetical protein
MPVTHTFVSAIADDPAAQAAGEVLPQAHWNAAHTLDLAISEITGLQSALAAIDADVSALEAVVAVAGNSTVGIGTYLVTGATIAWVTGYQYLVGAASYYLDGTAVASAQQSVTLTAAHATLDRIDVLVLDASGTLSAIAGTAAVSPAEPTIDPSVYLRLGIVLVVHNTTAPSITVTDIYLNNAEWTATASAGTINPNSTSNPRSGTKDIEGTAVAANAYVELVKPAAGTVDLGTQNTLVFYVRVKAAFPSAKAFRLGWYSGTALRGAQVTVSNGLFGFNSATTGSYQQIVVPISAFNVPQGNLVTSLRITVIGGGAAVGFYLDDIVLNSGATTIPSLTASRAVVTDVSGQATASTTTATEVGYLSGVTSSIQTQLNAKQPLDADLTAIAGLTSAADKGIQFTGSGTAGTYDLTTAGKALLDDANAAAQLVTLGFTSTITELNYTDGVTSAIQTQLDTKSDGTIPQNSQSAAYTTVLGDAGKHIYHPSSDNNARTFTIAANASVAYVVGTAITFVNEINTVTIAINSDTLTLAGAGTTGSRTLAANGMATALKVASTKWVISGTGLT